MIEKTNRTHETSKPPATNQRPFQNKSADRPLTRKQQAFVNELLTNPKQSATKAVLKTYNVANAKTASVIATENLAKPSIVSKLGLASDMIETALMETVEDWKKEDNSRKREIAMDTAKYIHDKIHGKATQKVETTNKTLQISIDLTGVLE